MSALSASELVVYLAVQMVPKRTENRVIRTRLASFDLMPPTFTQCAGWNCLSNTRKCFEKQAVLPKASDSSLSKRMNPEDFFTQGVWSSDATSSSKRAQMLVLTLISGSLNSFYQRCCRQTSCFEAHSGASSITGKQLQSHVTENLTKITRIAKPLRRQFGWGALLVRKSCATRLGTYESGTDKLVHEILVGFLGIKWVVKLGWCFGLCHFF